jgi:FkbM family methyltransferase
MGIYKNLGIRKKALQLAELINWIRLFQLSKGLKIFNELGKKKPELIIELSNATKIFLRNNYSDVAIFKQVFLEEQYYLYNFPLKEANRIIDAGANIGLAAIYFSRQFPDAEIISIEPELNNFQQLQKNTSNNSNIHCENAAIWGKDDLVEINNPDSLAASFMVSDKTVSINGASIPAITISSLLAKYNWDSIDILKMDIEGAEKEVFENNNAGKWLAKTRLLIIELHDNYKPNCSKTFFKALEPFEYEAVYHHENIFVHFKH